MQDNQKRKIEYMRLSITDKCNFRCKYCMPNKDIEFLREDELLTSKQIKDIVYEFSKLGIEKIKITGGEPLLRNDVVTIIQNLKNIEKIKEVTLTTNGLLLHKYIDDFIKIGLNSINISIDTLDEKKHFEITKRDSLKQVVNNIILAKEKGFKNIKLNVVPLKELGEKNIYELVNFANEYNLNLRFIEMMPIGLGRKYESFNHNEILNILKIKYGEYKQDAQKYGNGPANYYTLENLNIKIGIIAALSNKFCQDCNRIRITSTGNLKQCLNFNTNINIKEKIKTPQGLKEIEEFIFNKPLEHKFKEKNDLEEKLNMFNIGG